MNLQQAYATVRRLHELTLTPGTGRVAAGTDPAIHPDGQTIAFTGMIADTLADTRTRICLVDNEGCLRVISDEPGSQRLPVWSPDGAMLAFLTSDGSDLARVVIRSSRTLERLPSPRVDGAAAILAFSPDSTRLLVTAAERLADVGDVQLTTDPQAPRVRSTDPAERGRHLWIHHIGRDHCELVPIIGVTVWEAAWLGDQAVAVIGSAGWAEGDWFRAKLYQHDLNSGRTRMLPTSGPQLAQPWANAAGTRIAVIEGLASDRGNLAGQVRVINPATGDWNRPHSADVDVTGISWLANNSLAYIGIRGQHVVAGRLHPDSRSPAEVTWSDDGSCGRHMPVAGVAPSGATVVIRDDYDTPPAVLRFDPHGNRTTVLSLAPPATADLVALSGYAETVSWPAPDHIMIFGTLCRPDSRGPHPLVLHVHGGPVDATTNAWNMQNDTTRTLVAAGYAVLHPNPRGSVGRGSQFCAAVLHDMGGADADDLLSGVTAMIDRGIADADRIAIAGTSYGGFMATWLPGQSDMFRAAVAMSPVTDWASLYYTSNIASFVELFMGGSPTQIPDQYALRSPVARAPRIRTPTLLMAGALDLCTPAEQAARFQGALGLSGGQSQLVIYPNEGHGAGAITTQIDQAARTLAWFSTHLG